jgi:putative FmdB family regulatory protein
MPLYQFTCPSCDYTDEALVPVSARDARACPKCDTLMTRPVVSVSVRPDPFSWSNENNGKGRYIGQLQRTIGSKRDQGAYCKNRQEAIDKAHQRGYSVDKSVY